MQIGAIIENGPQNWQILQQKNGSADFSLSGRWALKEMPKKACVYARVVSEDSSDIVIPWVKCNSYKGCKWSVRLEGIPAGGLYRIETCLWTDTTVAMEWCIRGDIVHHVGVGDVFVIAGQSNGVGYGKDPSYDPPEIGVHLLRNNGSWDLASHPFNDSTGTVHEVNRDEWNTGNSPYLSYGKFYKKFAGVPVGLIICGLGGSPLSRWNAESGDLYKNMLDTIRLQPCGIIGILWYQGCEDTNDDVCDIYLQRFANMVSGLRRDLGRPDLPFFTFQLNRYMRYISKEKDIYWGKIREAQRQAAKKLDGVYISPTIDCIMSDAIHNSSSSSVILGQRMAKVALYVLHSKKFLCMAPDLNTAVCNSSRTRIKLTFNNVYGRLYFYEAEASELLFTVEDKDGVLGIKSYTVEKNIVFLELSRNLNSKGIIHFAYGQNPKGVIPVDYETHLPMLCFYNVPVV